MGENRTYQRFKIQPKKLLTKMIQNRLESKKEIPTVIGDKVFDNVDALIAYLQKDELKWKEELENLCQNFISLINGYKQAIERKYKIISWKISKLSLPLLDESLINSGGDTEIINELDAWIASWKREQSNFDYQFSFFKSRMASIHNEYSKKLPNIDIKNMKYEVENDNEKNYIKQSLQFLTGIVFENTVPLWQSKETAKNQKYKYIESSLLDSNILVNSEDRKRFIQQILQSNNYNSITPVWSKSITKETKLSAEEFHQNWDNQGPILLLIKTSSNWIFGAVSPQGFESINNYAGSKFAFLFSFKTTTEREPIIWRVKPEFASFAVKNNESKYSPGFGKSNKSDLFISFKNLSKSYSCVGTIYELPDFQDREKSDFQSPETFFTGVDKNWEITNIEAYSLWELN